MALFCKYIQFLFNTIFRNASSIYSCGNNCSVVNLEQIRFPIFLNDLFNARWTNGIMSLLISKKFWLMTSLIVSPRSLSPLNKFSNCIDPCLSETEVSKVLMWLYPTPSRCISSNTTRFFPTASSIWECGYTEECCCCFCIAFIAYKNWLRIFQIL